MARYDVTKGVTSAYLVLNNDSMYVSKGGVASNTTVNDRGAAFILSGGKAYGTEVNSDGYVYVSKGGGVNNTNVNSYGRIYVSKGGTASFVNVGSGGCMYISGGTVSSATLNYSGYFTLEGGTINKLSLDRASGGVYSGGGTINDLTMSGGYISFYSGTINRATVQNGDIYCYSGGKINSATFNGGRLTVSSNCAANKITLENSARMDVYQSGAKASGITVRTGGSMYIGSGAVLTNVTLAGGDADPAKDKYAGRVAAYGTIKGLTIGSGTSVGLFEGCSATKVKWTPGDGTVNIWGASVSFTSKYSGVYLGSNGAFVKNTKELVSETLGSGASAYVAKGGVASGLEIASGGSVIVWNGGTALQTQLGLGENYSFLVVSSGGIASDVTIFENGYLSIYGGQASDVTICNSGSMYISRGTASGIKVESGGSLGVYYGTVTDVEWTPFNGELQVYGGARITFTDELTGVYIGTNGELTSQANEVEDCTLGQVEETGFKYSVREEMYVMSGGKAERTAVGVYGSMYVFDGGSAAETAICDGGEVYVYYGGSASGIEIDGGWLGLNGGTATDVTLNGYMTVAGGSAVNVTVSSGYYGFVEDGGVLNGATLCSGYYRGGGTFYLSSGAVAANLTLEYGACLYVSKGAKVTNVTSSYGSYIQLEKGATVKKITAVEAWSPDCDYDLENGWADKKKKTINEHIVNSTPTQITSKTYNVQIDENQASFYNNYVGFGDEIDFLKVRLDDAANLSFNVYATDASKFTVWRWDDGKNKLVSLQASTLKLKEESYIKSGAKGSSVSTYYYVETKDLLLNAGDYYLSMESTNAAKGGNAYYNVYVGGDFFYLGNNADDDWTALPDDYDLGELEPKPRPIEDDWVGYGDAIDYRKFTVSNDMTASFDVFATDASKFTLYQLVTKTDKKGKTTNSLKQLKSITLKEMDKGSGDYSGSTGMYDFKKGEEYYLSMESTNAAKGGSASYGIELTLSDTGGLGGGGGLGGDDDFIYLMDALAMPETSDSPTMTDALSSALLDADVLADVSAFDKLAAVSDASVWQSVAKLA